MDFRRELETLYQRALEQKAQGHQAQAEDLEKKAAALLASLKIRAEQKPEDVSTADVLLYLAEREWAILGDHENVLAKINRALAIREKQYGPEHAQIAAAITQLAEFHFLAGRFGQAEPLYRRAVSIPSPSGKALEGLAHTLAALGRPQEAEPFFGRAIEAAGQDADGKRALYFLLVQRAEGLDLLHRTSEAAALRLKAVKLLPQNNPGEQGFHV